MNGTEGDEGEIEDGFEGHGRIQIIEGPDGSQMIMMEGGPDDDDDDGQIPEGVLRIMQMTESMHRRQQ